MTDLPDLKLKALVSFPATVLDGTGIDVVKQNGNYQFNLDFGDFAPPVSGIADPTHQNALLWNNLTGAYVLVPISLLSVPEAPNDGVQYGRQSLGWTPVVVPSNTNPLMDGVAAPGIAVTYARGDHVHPSDASRASVTYVDAADALKAPLASPLFTGAPAGPTAAPGTNTTQFATTAFVLANAGAIRAQKFTVSGTYTPDPNLIFAIIECVGGGGGGGSCVGAASSVLSSGGGGSGGYSRTIASAAAIGASKAVTIGSGGPGGAAAASPGNPGAAGGDTSVGALCLAKGGSGGAVASLTLLGMGGLGGVAGTGDLSVAGNPGGGGVFVSGVTGSIFLLSNFGANSHLGPGALPPIASGGAGVTGVAAIANSGGGGSGAIINAAVNNAGGNGGTGIVFITEYCAK